MRVGVVIGQPQALDPVRSVTLPFNINGVALAAMHAALQDTDFLPRYAAQVHESRERLYAAFDRLGYGVLAERRQLRHGPRRRDGAGHRRRWRQEQIHVRDRSKDPTTPGCIRMTAGMVEHTNAAIEALEDVMPFEARSSDQAARQR